MNKFRLAGISGSLRQGSSNTAILRTLQASLPPEVEMTLLPLEGIPLYNQDLDGPNPPEAVREFKAAVESSDGVVMCSPEYNFGMPGVLKNAIDWASRPAFASPLKGKPVLVMTCSPAFTGGVRAQAQLRETLGGALSRVISRPQVVIAGVNAKIEGGRLTDPASLSFALEAVNDLLAEIGLLRAARTPAMQPAEG
ncbi:NADPH azoreductase [Variovorax sp. SRS16]|uniref:NADPH-dependent FMN reductase n=1 Tax=Variovorax sp. SRS16 TaxID=282217 RepID=UPI00131610D6|nr:NAD(P)H-dependent oxidoreductase [Variovorax sp. SRS16]VTU30988.1 NADPH azoreductase [Variovorax sp. SRS16]